MLATPCAHSGTPTGDALRYEAMEEALIKGRGFNSAQAVRRRHAGERLATLLAMVPEDTRKLVEFPPSAAEWIPMRHSRDLVEASAALIYENPQDMIRAGYDQVRADLKGVYQILVKGTFPPSLGNLLSQQRHHRDAATA